MLEHDFPFPNSKDIKCQEKITLASAARQTSTLV